jgi:K+/H+ antiporter YhaU regulatory subunit KhtT
MKYNLDWFRNTVAPYFIEYEMKYKRFSSEDNSEYIDRVEIEGKDLGCEIIFYNDDKLYVFLFDYKNEKEILNLILFNNQDDEKEEVFETLKKMLKR